MTSTYSQPTGNATNPLQPASSGPNAPQGLNIGAPGHTPVPQHAEHTMTGANTTESSTYGKPSTFGNQGENFAGTGTDYNSGANTVSSNFNKDDNFTSARTGTEYGAGAYSTAQSNFEQPATYGKGEHYTGAVPAVGEGAGYGNRATTGTNTTSGTAYGQDQNYGGTGGETVLDITAPDNKTIVISGHGSGYTMTTTFENRRELFTIRRGTPNTPARADETDDLAAGTTDPDETSDETATGEPFVAQVEPHQVRATKFSWKGGQQMKLKDWLGGRGTATHTIHEGGRVYEWRKSFANRSRRLELFCTDQPDTRIAWVQKIATTEEDKKEHEHGLPPLPAHPATAKMWVTSSALPILDMAVVSFLLVDRESRGDPLHS